MASIVLISLPLYGQTQKVPTAMEWSSLPDLPDGLGRSGVFVGVHNEALIVAGGTNFPDPVWENDKRWHDDIFVLTKGPDGWQWHTGFLLPRPLAYGAAVSTDQGVICMGGNDAERVYDDVFLLRWDAAGKTIRFSPLPSLPRPCAYSAAARIGNVIYLAGGTDTQALETAMSNFWSLDMTGLDDTSELQWKVLPPWPGPSRAFNLTAAQHNGAEYCVYVVSGRRMRDGHGGIEFLTDVCEFSPGRHQSGKTDPWRKRTDLPRSVMAGTAMDVGQSHIFVISGDDGSLWGRAEELKDSHPGFPKPIWAYHTITDTWIQAGSMPSNQVTTNAVRWGADSVNSPIIIACGEIRPRVRTPNIWSILPVKRQNTFGGHDWAIIGVYLAMMVGVGVFFTFRNKNTDDFFRGGQRVPWFVAGLSIFATMLSSITFLAIPAKAYMTDWVFFLVNMTVVLATPFVICYFLPFFRNIDATSAYEYLEKRFNRVIRLFASMSFVIFQVGRMAIVMYLPALALAAITPLTEMQCILLLGVFSIVYCTLGGLEGVVWTDTLQSFVLLGGAILTLVVIISRLEGGLESFFTVASAEQKFHWVDWDFSRTSFTTAALWVVLLGGFGQSLVPYSSDMAVIQRYMSVPSIQKARRSIWTNAIAVIPTTILFFSIGTALFVFYKTNPDRLDPTLKNDAIFTLFIARELPAGFGGLLVAGIFAAAQSTLSTSMNSCAAALITDFVRPFKLCKTEKGLLRLARVFTVGLGCLGTALALLFVVSDIKSVWDVFMAILGLIGGSMCGLFCLGIFTVRTNGVGAVIGALAGAVGLYWVQGHTQVHYLLYATIGVVFCVVVGYAASFLFPGVRSGNVEGLTIHTLGPKQRSD
ncbi:MAG: sodium/solute symporter [Sedimentisphaerales bacterium]|nr:sodium/solute symporter [Sedimentisphaerales bacterium]